ncbi:Acg family FMN-binding oxidoreductase [Nocardia elegans]
MRLTSMAMAKNSVTLGTPTDAIVSAVIERAQRAPSVHNTQPWRWVFDGTGLDLFADPDRILPATDPHGRERIISCGAVLHHAHTAFAALGWHTDTVRLPDRAQPDHLAAVTFRPWREPPAGIAERAAAIDLRYTDRLPMYEPQNWDQVVPRLKQLVSPHGLFCDALAEDIRARVAAVSDIASAARQDDPMYQDELHWWTGHSGGTEGVPPSVLVSDAEFSHVDIGRAFPRAPHSMRRPDLTDHARLIVLSSPDDSLEQWLHTGEALSAVLLECAAAELSTCPITHVTELPAGRRALAALLPHRAFPQVLIRVGASPDDEPRPPVTPRHPLDEVLRFTRR